MIAPENNNRPETRPKKAGFKKGQSGNPRGRPKGSSISQRFRDAADRACKLRKSCPRATKDNPCEKKRFANFHIYLSHLAIDHDDAHALALLERHYPKPPAELMLEHRVTPTEQELIEIDAARDRYHRDKDAAVPAPHDWGGRLPIDLEGEN